MTLNCLVSVIIPYFNAEKYIEKSIESLLNQSYSNLDIILINDGSTDQSGIITAQFNDPRIRFFSQTNKGVSAARNTGLNNIKGDYFCFLDADDILPPKSIECRMKVFEENPNVHFVDGMVNSYDQNMTKVTQSWQPSFRGNPFNDLILLEGKTFLGLTWMIKTTVLGDTRFKSNMTHAEDLLFYINIARKGGEYDYCNEITLNYRKSNESAMKNLKGLEEGYKILIDELSKMAEVNLNQLRIIKKKTRQIMIKSYLRDFDIASAISVYLNK